MRLRHRIPALGLIIVMHIALLDACATKSQTGALIGAAGGAVVGGAIGKAVVKLELDTIKKIKVQ